MFAKARTLWCPSCFALLILAGCSGSDQPPSKAVATPPSESDERLVHDVGDMLAGPVVKHKFEFVNKLSEKITIEKPGDIAVNCGCSGIEPAKRTLEPGEKTDVTLTLQIVSKHGPMNYGGMVTWTSPSGKKSQVQFLIVGRAIPPIIAEPQSLAFEPEEVKNRTPKTVRFRGNVAVLWRGAIPGCTSPYFKISNVKYTAEGLSCDVICDMPSDAEASVADLILIAHRKADAGGAIPEEISSRVSMRARQKVELLVAPAVPLFQFGPSNKATSRVILLGEAARNRKLVIKEITCNGYDAQWTTTSSSESLIIEITLTRKTENANELSKSFSVLLDDRILRVPFTSTTVGVEKGG